MRAIEGKDGLRTHSAAYDGAEAMSDRENDGSGEAASTNLDPIYRSESRGATDVRNASFFEWARAVRDAPPETLKAHVKATLFILATYADKDGRDAFPSAETIASKLGKTERSVRDDLAAGVEAGYITRRRRNRQNTYRYRLTIPLRPEVEFRSDALTGSGVPVATGSGLPDTYPDELPRARQDEVLSREDRDDWIF